MEINNFLNLISAKTNQEVIDEIVQSESVRVERIISTGQCSPKDFWYDQHENEWVMVLKGEAKLEFEHNEVLSMKAGDYIDIPARKKHRVLWTQLGAPTIWLAVFYK